jgi:hypothetical protein
LCSVTLLSSMCLPFLSNIPFNLKMFFTL